MARIVGRHARQLTSPISDAHLAAAAEGIGGASTHAFVDAVLRGDRQAIPAALDAVAKIGHCSGWDSLVGIVMVVTVQCSVAAADRPELTMTIGFGCSNSHLEREVR